jgi:hypothetical protein
MAFTVLDGNKINSIVCLALLVSTGQYEYAVILFGIFHKEYKYAITSTMVWVLGSSH